MIGYAESVRDLSDDEASIGRVDIESPDKSFRPNDGAPLYLGISAFVLVLILAVTRIARGFVNSASVLIGIVAVSIGFGMIPLVAPAFFKQMPHALHPLPESGILLTAIVAVLPNLFFNGLGNTAQARDAAVRQVKAAEVHRVRAREPPDRIIRKKVRRGASPSAPPPSTAAFAQGTCAPGGVTGSAAPGHVEPLVRGERLR